MLRKLYKISGMTALLVVMLALGGWAQNDEDINYDKIKIDRYLDVEVWTNNSDNEFYVGDNIVINFRTNRDAFVAIYSIDSRGRVNMLFPADPSQDNFVQGSVNYRIPDGADDFDLVVTGPDGAENIQVIASKERFPLPDWYPESGLICDWEDRLEFMDYLNSNYFVRYDGQRFAFDRSAIYINEWEDNYYRPVYYPDYPTWTVSGNIYIDYPWGSTVYINGIYWGIAPLYIPRIYVGWHTISIYDYYGYCWESDIHITRYNTVVLDRNVIVTRPGVMSKYKEVRTVGYRDPMLNGYPNYKAKTVTSSKTVGNKTSLADNVLPTTNKKYIRGSTKIVKTDRGYESTGDVINYGAKEKTASGKTVSDAYKSSNTETKYKSKTSAAYKTASGERDKSSSGYYQRKTASSTYKQSEKKAVQKEATRNNSKIESKSSSSDKSDKGKSSSDKKSSSGTVKQSSPSSGSGKTLSGSKSSAPQSSGNSGNSGSKSSSSDSKSSSGGKGKR